MEGQTQDPDIGDAVAAARKGDTDALRAWLRAGGDPNRHDDAGWTPLLAATVRGHDEVVGLLLGDAGHRADPDLQHRESGALPIHFAGQSGSTAVAARLLAVRPAHLEAIYNINGHTLLLQSVFFGHLELTRYALERGANAAATTLRGLAALEFAQQFQNRQMIDLILPYDRPQPDKAAYYQALLKRVTPSVPPGEEAAQALADRLVSVIADGLGKAAGDPEAVMATLAATRELVESLGADVNRLGGVLRQPPLVVTVTGTDGNPAKAHVSELRRRLAEYLLAKGADPTKMEVHPMGAHAIIRASVFNHLEILRMMGHSLTPQRLAAALNQIPVVNGLTALHDGVLRASMVGPDRLPGYLDQLRWQVACGARWDIEDFSGQTQRQLAESVANPERRGRILAALGIV